MKGRKTLRTILFTMYLPFFMSSCDYDHSEFHYNDKIGDEKVIFDEHSHPLGNRNILEITRTNEAYVKYVDNKGNDLKLEYILIRKNGKLMKYHKDDEVGEEIVKEGQVQFDDYLKKIIEIKKAKGLEDIRGKSVKDIKE